ncbi:hypothetical protein B0A48_08787 [Cryoendolithus antarcticus]|uniref:Nitrogen regulatory protein areA GATA-like domain-containing protein n=1 Tax=Cryoendolithus antarcticus TaxID=1507870 RepID=A0A1V8T4G6_9PEZI|nr:hypothetical protein B0A48_08787 [Cryoendolithus antarcticus]
MAEVLTPRNDSNDHFYTPRRSASSQGLSIGTSPPLGSSPRRSYISLPASTYEHAEHTERVLPSQPATAIGSRASSSDLSSLLPRQSTPVPEPTTSLEHKYAQTSQQYEDDYPQFDSYLNLSASESSDEQTESATTDTTASDESPLATPSVSDDTAIKTEPSQHVDYLSHDWREEDVWSSWRHIVSQRKVYGQQSRLENAAWRTWVKSKFDLPTVSPETLNWLKESDVTWLYGPLKPATSHPITKGEPSAGTSLSRTNSFVHKKPILKKRSMSEVMLQRSLSAASLLKQAAASIQSQGRTPSSKVAQPEAQHYGLNSFISRRQSMDYFTSRDSSSGAETPSDTKEHRHIRFDDNVEQCIAVECKPDDDEDDVQEHIHYDSSSDSDDEGLMIMRRRRRPNLSRNKSSQQSTRAPPTPAASTQRKMIETVASTTLKYRTDSPDPEADSSMTPLARSWSAGRLSPSPSAETLRPSRPSRNFLIPSSPDSSSPTSSRPSSSPSASLRRSSPDADDETGWSFGASNPKSSLGAASLPLPDETHHAYTRPNEGEGYGIEGMRRTESGMFMPYEEDEDDAVAAGLFGRISEGVNTARDIAHVLWNVGWVGRRGEGGAGGGG